jgi:exonuclease SbcC
VITELQVRNFQSLSDVSLAFGKLTVIVGPSNSGKSAVGRALKGICRNSVVPGHVTKGSTSAALLLQLNDGSAVVLKRGKGESTYALIDQHGHQENYPKSGTSVPEDVQKLLKMPDGDPDLFFSTQFDGPWLLGVTGSQAAKVLGDLTNVSMLAEAAREANRRRQEVLKLGSIRRKDAEAAVERVRAEYSDLASRKQAVEQAQELLKSVIDVTSRAEQLKALADRANTAQEVVTRSNTEADRLSLVIEQAKLQIEGLEQREQAADYLKQWADTAFEQFAKAEQFKAQAGIATDKLTQYEQELHATLKEAGTCPLCQQKIS